MQVKGGAVYPCCFADLLDGDIFKVSSQGGLAMRLVSMGASETSPKVSPCGKWVAFASNVQGNNDVYIVPVNVDGVGVNPPFPSSCTAFTPIDMVCSSFVLLLISVSFAVIWFCKFVKCVLVITSLNSVQAPAPLS